MEIKNENNLIQEAFEVEAEEIGFCLDQKWGDYENPYENSDTFLAFNLFKKGWQAKSQAVPEGFVLVPKDQFESLCMFKDLYKRAIINARKRKDQLNWAHVAGLGVGSGRAVELCKMLNIDPSATNMHEMIEAQEQSHDSK